MSYSYEIKREICGNRLLLRHGRAIACGMLLYGKSYVEESICLHTEHRLVARLYADLLSDMTGLCGSITAREVKRSGRRSMFVSTIDSLEDRLSVLSLVQWEQIASDAYLTEEEDPAYLSGVFLACGTVSDPEKEYRAEFVVQEKKLCDDLVRRLSALASPKVATRRNSYVVYYKESEHIEDLLTYISAQKSALKLMEVKIMKGLRNQVNRTTNCETANISKTVEAALAQVDAIRRIEERCGLEALDEDLRDIAEMRRDFPEYSLRELGERLSLTRSAVNRKLQKIVAFSLKL